MAPAFKTGWVDDLPNCPLLLLCSDIEGAQPPVRPIEHFLTSLCLHMSGHIQVLMCPPTGCMATGCIGHRIADKQPIACGVDTVNADVGTVFMLPFTAYNSAGDRADAQRVITVVSPCSDGQYLCGSVCSPVNCVTRESVAGLPGASPPAGDTPLEPPVLVMLPTRESSNPSWAEAASAISAAGGDGRRNTTLYLVYGEPSRMSFAPCASLTAANGSAAAAAPACVAAAFNGATGIDLCSLISVRDVSEVTGQVKCPEFICDVIICHRLDPLNSSWREILALQAPHPVSLN